jgi:hypothetical protein
MPDVNPTFSGSARLNGKFGSGAAGTLASNLGKVPYFNTSAFEKPNNVNATAGVTLLNLIGNAPRTGAFGLRNPVSWNLDSGLRRTIPLHNRLAFTLEADAFNTLNHPIFGSPNAVWGSSAFGTISGVSNKPRSFEVAGHITF